MRIVVIDGQGGRMGSLFIEKWRQANGKDAEIIAVGTNSMATAAMLKAGADAGATGENPVVVNVKHADYVVGPIGIMATDALYGEVTEKMATAVATSSALKVLIPVNSCNFRVVGVGEYKLSELIMDAVRMVQKGESL